MGHFKHFQSAKKYGDILIVSVTPDKFVQKGFNRPYFKSEERMQSLSSVEAIDFGICSVVVHEYGKNAFHEYIEQGDLFYGSDYNQIKEIIENSDKRLIHSDPTIIIQNENQKFDTIMNYILQVI